MFNSKGKLFFELKRGIKDTHLRHCSTKIGPFHTQVFSIAAPNYYIFFFVDPWVVNASRCYTTVVVEFWIGLRSRLWSDDPILEKHTFLKMIFISVEAQNVVHLSLFILRDTNGLLAPVRGTQKLEFSTPRFTLQDQYLIHAFYSEIQRFEEKLCG